MDASPPLTQCGVRLIPHQATLLTLHLITLNCYTTTINCIWTTPNLNFEAIYFVPKIIEN